MAELVNAINTFTYDKLIGGTEPAAILYNATIVSGSGKLSRGSVLGKITASGKLTLAKSTNTDGSQTGNCILAEDVDATSADVVAPVYVAGTFNREALTFGGTDTAAAHEDALRNLNIYLTSIQ